MKDKGRAVQTGACSFMLVRGQWMTQTLARRMIVERKCHVCHDHILSGRGRGFQLLIQAAASICLRTHLFKVVEK